MSLICQLFSLWSDQGKLSGYWIGILKVLVSAKLYYKIDLPFNQIWNLENEHASTETFGMDGINSKSKEVLKKESTTDNLQLYI